MVVWSKRWDEGIIAENSFVGGMGFHEDYSANGVHVLSSSWPFVSGKEDLFDGEITCSAITVGSGSIGKVLALLLLWEPIQRRVAKSAGFEKYITCPPRLRN